MLWQIYPITAILVSEACIDVTIHMSSLYPRIAANCEFSPNALPRSLFVTSCSFEKSFACTYARVNEFNITGRRCAIDYILGLGNRALARWSASDGPTS